MGLTKSRLKGWVWNRNTPASLAKHQIRTIGKLSSREMATTQAVTCTPGHSSPKSVMLHTTDSIVEQFALASSEHAAPHTHKIRVDSLTEPTTIVCEDTRDRWTGVKRPRCTDPWICPASKKSKLTSNPVQSIVAQVTDRIRQGCHRPDRKNPISLAVSSSTWLTDREQ